MRRRRMKFRQVRFAGVAQVVEQLICNQLVGGSIPFSGFFCFASPILIN